jgi:hypothetical protein
MYQIYADGTLIYDSTLDEYKIGKGSISLETNKSGSFEFSLYPDHFHYDKFVRMKTVIVVYKSGKIVFRGRVLSDVTDYWNKKVITCEGELGFLQDSIIRPFNFTGTPEELFRKFITEHNAQVDDLKKFKIGKVTVTDPNNTITRSNSEYETAFDNMDSRLIEDSLGGYFYISHENEEEAPTLNYLIDFEKVSSQTIEFGVNLKNYTKTINAGDIATAIIPLGATIDDGNSNTDDPRLTIASVNNGVDYVYNAEAVALRGWIFKTVVFDDVTVASNLKAKGEAYLQSIVNQAVTIELNAIDLHLLDHDIESFRVGDYIEVLSEPHNFNATMLCNKQTIDLLKPENDTVTLGHAYSSFTESSGKIISSVSKVTTIANLTNKNKSDIRTIAQRVTNLEETPPFLELVYPVGSMYISTVSTNPVDLFGFGTWEQIKDVFLLSAGDTYLAGSTGGSTNHSHTLEGGYAKIAPLTSSAYMYANTKTANWTATRRVPLAESAVSNSGSIAAGTTLGGSTDETESLPPYLAVYVWKRVS